MAEKAKAKGRSHSRGHPIVWMNEQWVYEDNKEPIPGYGGKDVRPCVKCGKVFEGSNNGDADPCLGELPGVDNACCGHGVKEESYIRFTNGVVVKGFDVEKISEKNV
ncbi:hypothetical protein KAR10_04135 [bacterium]|nr:hypothetical protein [bacterium]